MTPIDPGRPHALHGVAATRRIEALAAAALPPHTLMRRAGLAVARLTAATQPHSTRIWIACGPGNNGGDGLEAAIQLKAWGRTPLVSWCGDEAGAPADTLAALARTRDAGIVIARDAPTAWDGAVDALLGIGHGVAERPLTGALAHWRDALNAADRPVLAVDLPSGLAADTGRTVDDGAVRATHTLNLLTLKPGCFTASGRDASGRVWLDDLGIGGLPAGGPSHVDIEPDAELLAGPGPHVRPHDSHKGRYGDVAIVGGAAGMTGAALLAARAALFAGAGRVLVTLLGDAGRGSPHAAESFDAVSPELMMREPAALDFARLHVVCGCGGGDAVAAILPRAIRDSKSLVLDADALNAIARDAALTRALLRRTKPRAGEGPPRPTVLTPHPLEAARLLGMTGASVVQNDRLAAARELANRFGATVVLKGSGSIVAAPGRRLQINPTGNGRLATAGTGDVLAGVIGARLAHGADPFEAVCESVYRHGWAADRWRHDRVLTAAALAERVF